MTSTLAKGHLKDAVADVPGIATLPETLAGFEAPAGGAVHLIEYVRVPNEATRDAMYDVLLAPGLSAHRRQVRRPAVDDP